MIAHPWQYTRWLFGVMCSIAGVCVKGNARCDIILCVCRFVGVTRNRGVPMTVRTLFVVELD